MKVLVIDVGGTHVKIQATGRRTIVKIPSGPDMTPTQMIRVVQQAVEGWDYDAVSIGLPAPVVHGKPAHEPKNLGPGWVGFNFRKAFGKPVKVINDAAMQALGSYRGGRMLFLGLGTGLGSALIIDGILAPLELAHLPYRKGHTYEEYVGKAGLARLGKKKWRRFVIDVTQRLSAALEADYTVLGGGNAKLVHELPAGVRLGTNRHAFAGGYRLWDPRYTRDGAGTMPVRERADRSTPKIQLPTPKNA